MGKRQRVDWPSLILGIVFVLAALMSFRLHPAQNVSILVSFFVVTVIFRGIYMLKIRSTVRELFRVSVTPLLVIGVIDILIGVYFLFNIRKGVMLAPYVFALWFLMDSLFGLFELGWLKQLSTRLFWVSLVTNVIGLIIGMLLLAKPIVSLMTLSFMVGFYLMIAGLAYIMRAFSSYLF
ncbi:HdeD family acid-resistance protein [Vagococcus acidifermentans]|uniref:DUF308 domain-containing protein n=1 Tax=Vagococcus acidifermentans TaxID=564710 RepID=A0A430ARJ7_9ENTE|nr:DUF308 domain-containing protein [Vagococcus acidifermentans]RSU10683.1 hypothetical protein CBF27_10235 [Vagococcus acidifermentans]